MILYGCPGQGSQKPGFLAPWLEDAATRDEANHMSEVLGIDIAHYGVDADADTIRDTSIAQPLIVAASILSAHALARALDGHLQGGFAGHSVGEVAAAALAGVLPDDDALRFVRIRANAMAVAAAAHPTSMAAVIGGEREAVLDRLNDLGLTAANLNSSSQVVAAGAIDALERLASEPPAKTRVIPLSVAGAFHTAFMEPARQELAQHRAEFSAGEPSAPLWTNADGTLVSSGSRFVDLIVSQVASPVHWDRVMESATAAGVTGLIELLPGGTLTGLAKREYRGLPSVAIRTPADVDAAVALITDDAGQRRAAHAATGKDAQ